MKSKKSRKKLMPNVRLSDRTKHHVMSKTFYVYKNYNDAVMALCGAAYDKDRKIVRLQSKNQLLLEALSKTVEAIECCEGCR